MGMRDRLRMPLRFVGGGHDGFRLFESPRVLRRLHTLRRWSYEQEIKPFFTRGVRARCPYLFSVSVDEPGVIPPVLTIAIDWTYQLVPRSSWRTASIGRSLLTVHTAG
jgi:hypothetical protein